jgi:phosphoribosylformylglycinamidine synthase
VIKPRLDSYRGIAVGCGINPAYGDIDPYQMGLLAIDEAFRNVLAVGGRSDRVALLDNFCAGSCERPEILGACVRVAEACRDASLALVAPFISGKDSLNNEYRTEQGSAAIPTTLLVSSVAYMDDVRRAVSSDFKRSDSAILLVGVTRAELGGSAWYGLHGRTGRSVPQVDLESAREIFAAVTGLTYRKLLLSCHDLADGGLGVALAEMAFGGSRGATVDLAEIPRVDGPDHTVERNDVLLFSESPTRFLVEVAEDRLDEVRVILGDVPHAVIGATGDEPRLRIRGLDHATIVDESVDDLRRTFASSLDFGSPATNRPGGDS